MPDTRLVRTAVVVLVAVVFSGCGKPNQSPATTPAQPARPGPAPVAAAPTQLPEPPFPLPEPTARPTSVNGTDLTKFPSGRLSGLAMAAVQKRDYQTAVTAEYWAVQKGGGSQYNLACFYSMAGDPDAAFYWLQKAAVAEGADPDHAEVDSDFAPIRSDARFAPTIQFLRDAAAYHGRNPKPITLTYLPRGHDPKKPTPVLVLLHGRGSTPKHFFGDDTGELAERLRLPIVSVSGTKSVGPSRFVWSNDPKADADRLDAALASVADRITVAPAGRIALGFSEGGQMAVEIAARDPERYAGAIGMSPGAEYVLAQATPAPKLKQRRFVVTIGTAEHPGNKRLANDDVAWLKKAGAAVELAQFRDQGHELPPNFDELLPRWIDAILKRRK